MPSINCSFGAWTTNKMEKLKQSETKSKTRTLKEEWLKA